jgi:hypothetical protein
MNEPNRQPERMSRQAVCVLIGGLLGFGLAARVMFDDYSVGGKVPWATALGFILGGCIVGFFVGVLFVGADQERRNAKQPQPPAPRSDPPVNEGITEQPKPRSDTSIREP